MSGTAVATRSAADAVQSAAKAERKGWVESLQDEALSFVKGDNNAPWAILAETVIGCVPVLGQLVDARDIIKGLLEVAGAPASPLAWFNLITALIGLIPGGGDAAKRSLRAVKSGAVHIDELLDMIRKIYKGDPEKLLKDVLDVSKLRKQLDDILGNPNLTKHVSPKVRKSIDDIRAGLNRQFDAFKREIDDWLAKGRKTSADGPPTPKATPGTPAAKPETQAKAGSAEKAPHSDPASANTPNAAQQRTARFKSLSQKILGVLGEHMADYHCQEIKGWGRKAAHDQAHTNPAKLNDGSRMVQLWPVIPRGRGIDAVWKATGGKKPYAIIEAKASYNPVKTLQALLGEAGDKTEPKTGASAGGSSGRGGGAGGRGSKTGAGTGSIRQTNGKVTQMGHGWIQKRMLSITLADPGAKAKLVRDKQLAYSRHVLFFSIPHAVSHAEALIKLTAQQSVPHDFHSAHLVTREWGDADIDKVVDNRAGLVDEGRKR